LPAAIPPICTEKLTVAGVVAPLGLTESQSPALVADTAKDVAAAAEMTTIWNGDADPP